MLIDLIQTYQDGVFNQNINFGEVTIQTIKRESGFMPDVYPTGNILIGQNSYSFKHPILNINNRQYIDINNIRLIIKNNIWGNKIIIQDITGQIKIIIQSPFNYFGKRLSKAPLLILNNIKYGYSIKQIVTTSDSMDNQQIMNKRYSISMLGNFHKKYKFEFTLNTTLSSNNFIDTILKLLIFNYLYGNISDILMAEALLPELVKPELIIPK